MTSYEFWIDENGIFCCTCPDDFSFLLEGEDALNQLHQFDSSRIQTFKITREDIQFVVDSNSVILRNYKQLKLSEIGFYFDEIFDSIKRAIRKKQIEKNHKTIKNRVIAGSMIASTIGALAFTSLITTAHEKKHEDTMQQPHGIEKEFSVDWNQMTSDIVQSIKEDFHSTVSNIEIPLMERANEAQVTYLDFESARYSYTGEVTYDTYYDSVKQYPEKWGLPPNLIMGMFTQESAGNYTNLMQVKFDAWKEQIITVYNFDENKYQKFVLTDHPENYGSDVICITRQDMENPGTNISVACILLRQSLSYMNYHIGAGIQCYNFGNGNMKKVLNYTAELTGISKEDILSDQNNLDFMNYTDIIKVGDPDYLKHVMRYVENLEDGLNIRYINDSGEIDELHVTILPEGKTK